MSWASLKPCGIFLWTLLWASSHQAHINIPPSQVRVLMLKRGKLCADAPLRYIRKWYQPDSRTKFKSTQDMHFFFGESKSFYIISVIIISFYLCLWPCSEVYKQCNRKASGTYQQAQNEPPVFTSHFLSNIK